MPSVTQRYAVLARVLGRGCRRIESNNESDRCLLWHRKGLAVNITVTSRPLVIKYEDILECRIVTNKVRNVSLKFRKLKACSR
jgi:hypothetical protein